MYLLGKAERIGAETRKLCELIFEQQGRTGQRRMQGIVNLARKYEAGCIESAAQKAVEMGLRSYKAFCRLVKARSSNHSESKNSISQEHKLIRPSSDYGAFFDKFAAKAENDIVLSRENLAQVWQNADWLKVMRVFGLEPEKRGKNDEVWIKSPFTSENNASLHVHLKKNIFKDFSSGKGGGVLNFCQDLLGRQGRPMNCYQVAKWMLENGISVLDETAKTIPPKSVQMLNQPKANKPIAVDLRPFFNPGHEGFEKRGISKKACQYLGCGYLPESSNGAKSPLNGRLVFQVRGISQDLKPVILSHVGRALTDQQGLCDGRYWGFPFYKKLEIYNQDKLLTDPLAREQVARFGLVLVEGFFDVAVLVSAGCLNVGALMGAHITAEQIDRLKFIATHMAIGVIKLFLDRDEAGAKGTRRAVSLLKQNGFSVKVFDWDQKFERAGCPPVGIKPLIKDPADMSESQLKYLRKHEII
jgi:hypothetical protein